MLCFFDDDATLGLSSEGVMSKKLKMDQDGEAKANGEAKASADADDKSDDEKNDEGVEKNGEGIEKNGEGIEDGGDSNGGGGCGCGGGDIEAGGEVDADTEEDEEARRVARESERREARSCIKRKWVPAVLTISNTVLALASGMTIKFFVSSRHTLCHKNGGVAVWP
jgi:hypothetical protein